MPKQTRWAVKRDLDNAITQIRAAQYQLTKWGSKYEGPHPDYFEMFSALVLACDTLINGIEALKAHI